MEWELELEQQHLGALGLAGICREISRVARQAILPSFANLYIFPCLSVVLLTTAFYAHVAGYSSYPLAEWVTFFSFEINILMNLLRCTAAYVFCVASLNRTGGDLLPVHRVLGEGPPVVPFRRLAVTFLLVVVPFFVFFRSLFALDFFRLKIEIALPLRLLGWASAAYVAVVGQLVCVVSVLEDAALFSAVRRSRELLGGKFWAATCVLVTLDGCIVAVLKAFPALMLYGALDLGLGFQVAVWVAMFVVALVALCAVLVVALVAQPVVYMVCRSHHQEPSTAKVKGAELQIETAQ